MAKMSMGIGSHPKRLTPNSAPLIVRRVVMKKNKDMLIKKAGISRILKSSDLTDGKKCVEAYRGINAIHPIEWKCFESIINPKNAFTIGIPVE